MPNRSDRLHCGGFAALMLLVLLAWGPWPTLASIVDHPPGPRHPDASIEMVAHRGANLGAPENTLAAAELALERGANWIEVDVRTSRDGVMYLMHDRTVERTTDGEGVFAEMTSAEIDRLDAGAWFDEAYAGERVPRLRDFLAWAEGRTRVYLDVKAVDPKAFVNLLAEFDVGDDVFFWSGDRGLMDAICRLAPDLPHKRGPDTVAELIAVDEAWGLDVVETGPEHLTERFMAEAASRGIRVMAHLLDDEPSSFRRAVERQPDLANLDYLERFKRVEAATLDQMAAGKSGMQSGGVKPIGDGGLVVTTSLGHSHNDYYRARPLLGALESGMLSIEADVFLREGDLFVAHDPYEITEHRTLRRLYLDPLWEAFEAHGGAKPDHPFGGKVRASGRPVVLLVDFKSAGPPAWRALERQLRDYSGLVREVHRDAAGRVVVSRAPVIVVVSGNRPQRLIEGAAVRRTAIDGRFPGDLASDRPPHLMPMISTSFSDLASVAEDRGEGSIPAVLASFSRAAAAEGRLARVWATPDKPRAWRILAASGMQLINTDRPGRLAAFFDGLNDPQQAAIETE